MKLMIRTGNMLIGAGLSGLMPGSFGSHVFLFCPNVFFPP